MPRKPTIKSIRKKLDKAWRTVGKENAKCVICESGSGKTYNYNQLHPHHIIGRRHSLTRWELKNRLWVCPSHHTLSDQCVEYNQKGWFWSGTGDWLSVFMPDRKIWLEGMSIEAKTPKRWKMSELEDIYTKLLDEQA